MFTKMKIPFEIFVCFENYSYLYTCKVCPEWVGMNQLHNGMGL